MDQVRLAGLEARWQQSGAPSDHARLLAAQARFGLLTVERLAVAAYCGHEAAGVAVHELGGWTPNVQQPDEDEDPLLADELGGTSTERELERWVMGLQAFGKPVAVRAALAAARACVSVWKSVDADEASRPPHAMIRAVEAWTGCPCGSHERAAFQTALGRPFGIQSVEMRDHWDDPSRGWSWAYSAAELAVVAIRSLQHHRCSAEAAVCACRALRAAEGPAARVRAAIVDELLRWALAVVEEQLD